MQEHELSIIIPVYNGGPYIARCLESILRQRGVEKHEIIVVNDGSTDNTAEILDKFTSKHKNVRVITQKNAGVSVARNTGIEASNGKYITFVDADDMVGLKLSAFDRYFSKSSPLKIGKLNTFFVTTKTIKPLKESDFDDGYFINMLRVSYSTKADVILGGHIAAHYDVKCMTQRTYATKTVRGPDAKYDLLCETHMRENANFALYSRKMLDTHNLRFTANMDLDEDILFCMLAVLYAPKVATAPDVTYFYNRHSDTLSNISDESVWATKYKEAQLKKFAVLLNEISKMPQYMTKNVFGYWVPFYIDAANIKNEKCFYITCSQSAENACANCPVANTVLAHCKKTIKEKSL